MRSGIDCHGVYWEEVELKTTMKDISGQRFEKITPKFPVRIDGNNRYLRWLCECECGNLVVIRGDHVRNGHAKSCGCLILDLLHNKFQNKRDSMIGRKFGKLTVVSFDCLKPRVGDQLESYYWCQCDCGSPLVSKAAPNLVCGITQSCGCMHSVGEANIIKLLNYNNINYIYNKAYFKDLFGCESGLLRYDFILFDDMNIPYRIIEFDGEQHYKPISYFGGLETFENQKKNDFIKNQYALSHNIPLVRIPYDKRDSMVLDDLLGPKYLIKGGNSYGKCN